MEYQWNDTDGRKLKCLEKNLPQYPLSTIKPTWTGLDLNTGLFSERLAANDLNHIMVEHQSYL
jgi:hypothetical protein